VAVGSEVISVDGSYDNAVQAAKVAAAGGGGLLIPDTSDDPNDRVVSDVMDGYGWIVRELAVQLESPPSHAFVQAGVGGLAAAMVQGIERQWRRTVRFLTVEPDSAACVASALQLGYPHLIEGDLQTRATMLACGTASAAAVEILLRHGAAAVTVSEAELAGSVLRLLEAGGPMTTPSGAAGIAGLLRVANDGQAREHHRLDADSRVLVLVTEGAQADTHPTGLPVL
jgi:diaminopropionate ammonia-lyase